MANIFYKILDLSIDGSLVIIFMLLLRLAIKNLPKKFALILWALVFVRLVFPFSFEGNFSIYKTKDIVSKNSPISIESINAKEEKTEVFNQFENKSTLKNSSKETSLPIAIEDKKIDFFPYIYFSGLGFFAIYSLFTSLSFKNKLKDAKLLENNLYESSNIKTAFVYGIFRPKIYLPVGLEEREKAYILVHEETHINRKDNISKFLAFIITIIHWFNPLVWISYYLFSLDLELSCDEAVLEKMGSNIKKAYSKSLLALATKKNILTASPIAFGEKNTKVRIKNVLSYKKPRLIGSFLFIGIFVISLVACFSKPLEEINDNTSSENSQVTSENLEKKVSKVKGGVDDSDQIFNNYFLEKIKNYKELGIEIEEYKINSKKLLYSYDNFSFLDKIHLWELDYSLKPKDIEAFNKQVLDVQNTQDGWVSTLGYGPFLLIEENDKGLTYVGSLDGEKDLYNLHGGKMEVEMAIRYFYLYNSNITSSYYGDMKLVKFSTPAGDYWALLSQPIKEGPGGIYVVDRLIDTNRNVSILPYDNMSTLDSMSYFSKIQEKVDKGQEDFWLDPIKSTLYFTENILQYPDNYIVDISVVENDSLKAMENFYKKNESVFRGYFMQKETQLSILSSQYPSMVVDYVEFVTNQDRLKELNIEGDLYNDYNGFYIYNPSTSPENVIIDMTTKFFIEDVENLGSFKEVDFQGFLQYANSLDYNLLLEIVKEADTAVITRQVILP